MMDNDGLIDWEAVGQTAQQLVQDIGATVFTTEPEETVIINPPTLLEQAVPLALVGGFLIALASFFRK